MVKKGADVNCQTLYELQTPLHVAAFKGNLTLNLRNYELFCKQLIFIEDNVGITRELIDLGANVTALNRGGDTALHIAAAYGKPLKYLLNVDFLWARHEE